MSSKVTSAALLGRRSHPVLKGMTVAVIAMVAVEISARGVGGLESPPPVLSVPVMIAAYWGMTRGGLTCALSLLAYAALRWTVPGPSWGHSVEMQYRLVLLAVGLPFAAFVVGYLKERAEARLEDLQQSEKGVRALHAELTAALGSRERILEHSMDMICTANAAGQFTMVSAACERILGYEPAEMIGRKFMDFVHPEDHERTTLIATKIISGSHTQGFINRYVRKDGTYVHIMWSSRWNEADQLMYAIARDYSEQKAVDDERARYVAIIEATTDLVGMSWSNGRISYLNRAGREVLGIEPDEDITQLSVGEVYADWAAQLLTGHAADIAQEKGVWSGQTELHPKHGWAIPVSQIVLAHRTAEGAVEFMSTIARDITTIKELEARLREEAATDELTGLFNRRHFMERFHAAAHSATRHGHPLSFAICDLDGFKQINDRYGHRLGDEVLVAVGEILAAEIRGEDLVARYGGDEFCMMFPYVPAEQAVVSLERIRQRVETLAFPTADGTVGVTLTGGIADLDDASTATLIEAADQALYRAKAAGRNRICVHEAPLVPAHQAKS